MQKTKSLCKTLPKKGESLLNKHGFMQKILLSRMQNHSFHLMRTTLLKLWQPWPIPLQKKIQTQIMMMIQTQKSKPFIHPSLLQAPLTNPTPIAQVHILLGTYSKLIIMIALFHIGATATILHPKILPTEFWLPHNQMFRTANGETF